MRAAGWLAWRELLSRPGAFAAGVVMVCIAVALCSMTELMLRSRDQTVVSHLDQIGAAIRVLPAERSATDVARAEMRGSGISVDQVDALWSRVAREVSRMEGRLVAKASVEGRPSTVLGVRNWPETSTQDVALGSELASVLGKRPGDTLQVDSERFQIDRVLSPTGSQDDTVASLPLREVQGLALGTTGISELRLYPKESLDPDQLAERLGREHPTLHVLRTARGQGAEGDMMSSLREQRWTIYLVTSIVLLLSIFAWTFLNTSERTAELAMLTAVGAKRTLLTLLLSMRSFIVGAVGGALGYAVALALTWLGQGWFEGSWEVIGFAAAAVAGASLISVLGALPAAVMVGLQPGQTWLAASAEDRH